MGKDTGVCRNVIQILLVGILCISGIFSYEKLLTGERMQNEAHQWVDFIAQELNGNSTVFIEDHPDEEIIYRYYMPEIDYQMITAVEETEQYLQTCEGRQLWYIVDTMQQPESVQLEQMLQRYGLEKEFYCSYDIEDKRWSVYKLTEYINGQGT